MEMVLALTRGLMSIACCWVEGRPGFAVKSAQMENMSSTPYEDASALPPETEHRSPDIKHHPFVSARG